MQCLAFLFVGLSECIKAKLFFFSESVSAQEDDTDTGDGACDVPNHT